RRHTRWPRDWSSDVCSSDLVDRYFQTFGAGDRLEVAVDERVVLWVHVAAAIEPGKCIRWQGSPRAVEDLEVVRIVRETEDFEARSEERRVGKGCRGW